MDVSGDWRLCLTFVLGEATHSLHLTQDDGQVQGRYRTQFDEREIRGRVDADGRVTLRSGVHYQACGAGYAFEGRLQGDVMEGTVGLGEFGSARWRAERQA